MISIRIYNVASYWTTISYAQSSLSSYDACRNPSGICKLDGTCRVGIVYSIRSYHHRGNSFLFPSGKLWRILWICCQSIGYILMASLLGLVSIVRCFTWRSIWSHSMCGSLLSLRRCIIPEATPCLWRCCSSLLYQFRLRCNGYT